MSKAKIVDTPDLVRDQTTKAVLNTNREALDRYRQSRAIRLKNEQRIQNLENQMGDIKNILQTIVEKLNR